MATNKNAQIRYQALDRCLSNWSRRYYIDDLVEACNEALYLYNGESKFTMVIRNTIVITIVMTLLANALSTKRN